jgi:DNA-binding MarR family transcriptional regulator
MTQLDSSFGFQVSRLANALRTALEARLAGYGLTAPQWAALMRLLEKDDWPQKELGNALGTDKATIGGVIRRLEAKALVQRRRDDNDARYFLVSLTDKGRRIAMKTARFGADVNTGVLSDFTESDRTLFLDMLRQARDALQK